MREEKDVQDYSERLRHYVLANCKKCRGTDSSCSCLNQFLFCVAAYEACVPKDFWNIKKQDVTHNKATFRNTVVKYISKMNKVLSKGYGLIFLGDNGVGKTFFISYILTKAIRAGRTAYYTTLPQLEYDILNGIGNDENSKAIRKRLDWLVTSDFLAIDEIGKERRKKQGIYVHGAYVDIQVERILKQRCDDNMPTLLATNMDLKTFEKWYGSTIMSIIAGNCQTVVMEPGDFRKKLATKMIKDMGY